MTRVLLVDDDEDHLVLLSACLQAENYTVVEATNGSQGREWLISSLFDLIILDWTMPDVSGVELCRLYRSRGGTTPVLFLTGKTEIVDKETGFDVGGDDYLTKPFDMRELLARMRALLRRPKLIQGELLTARNIQLDTVKREVCVSGEKIAMTPKEFNLLEVFMRHPNQVMTQDRLLDMVWANDTDKSIDVVRQTIARLRTAISDTKNNRLIRTVHGIGYRLEV
ncbi:MAG TPA: response regulator transcription factor [Drouetiella sp.]|jgi:DNA-binding response OmpR family regulator